MYKLREYQANDIYKIRAEYRAGAGAVLHVSPTGSGKTVVFSHITNNAYNKGKSILILTHRNNLLQQTSEKLKENGLKHGIIAAGYPSIRYRVQVASVQTLVRRLQHWEHFDLIIADECHHFGSKTWQKIRNHFCKSKLYGCTATPLRLDNYGLGNDFDSMVLGPSYQYLIEKSYLSKPRYYVPDHINLDDIKKSMGDYNKHQLSERFNTDKYIIGNAIEHYSKLADKKPCMIFCINIHEAKKTADEFIKAGYKAIAVHSKLEKEKIKKAILDLRDGKIHVVTSCDMIGEGTDIPRVECIIQLRPTLSLCLNHQQNGRGLRPYPGKEFSIHIDSVGNCERHGLIHWPIAWKLTKEKFEPKISKVKTCKYCFASYPAFKTKCPYCGKEPIRRTKEGPVEKQGNLKMIDYKELNDEINKSESLEELQAIALKMNYKPHWAYHIWSTKNRQEVIK
jgi:superfamily II DNA or RNA helicase